MIHRIHSGIFWSRPPKNIFNLMPVNLKDYLAVFLHLLTRNLKSLHWENIGSLALTKWEELTRLLMLYSYFLLQCFRPRHLPLPVLVRFFGRDATRSAVAKNPKGGVKANAYSVAYAPGDKFQNVEKCESDWVLRWLRLLPRGSLWHNS